MLAYNYLLQWIDWIIPLVIVGATARVTYIASQKITDSENAETYDRKIKITLKAAVILVSIPAFINFIKKYF